MQQYHFLEFREGYQMIYLGQSKSNGWSEFFRSKYLSTLDQLKSITNESKATNQYQNFVLFSNMESKSLSQFLFENREITFDKSKKISLGRKFFCTLVYFHYYNSKVKVGIFIYTSACRSEAALQNALFEIFCHPRKHLNFSFS